MLGNPKTHIRNIVGNSIFYNKANLDGIVQKLKISEDVKDEFEKFCLNSVSYAVASKFNIDFSYDDKIFKEYYKKLDEKTLEFLAEYISNATRTIIKTVTIKSNALKYEINIVKEEKGVYNEKEEGGNKDGEEYSRLRSDARGRNGKPTTRRVWGMREYGRNSRKDGEISDNRNQQDRFNDEIRKRESEVSSTERGRETLGAIARPLGREPFNRSSDQGERRGDELHNFSNDRPRKDEISGANSETSERGFFEIRRTEKQSENDSGERSTGDVLLHLDEEPLNKIKEFKSEEIVNDEEVEETTSFFYGKDNTNELREDKDETLLTNEQLSFDMENASYDKPNETSLDLSKGRTIYFGHDTYIIKNEVRKIEIDRVM